MKKTIRKMITLSAAVLLLAGGWVIRQHYRRDAAEPEVFRITETDRGRISRPFIREIIRNAGKDAASHASLELHYYWKRKLDSLNKSADRNDWRAEYCNYLERLYRRAYRSILRSLNERDRKDFEMRESQWRNYLVPTAGDEGRYTDFDGHAVYLRNRTAYLESSPEKRHAVDTINTLNAPCGQFAALPVRFHYLERVTPDPDKTGKTYVERIAVIPPDFCHEAIRGKDRYHLAILFPTNEINAHSSAIGRERNLCIWKNGNFHGSFSLPDSCTVWKTEILDNIIHVRFTCEEKNKIGENRRVSRKMQIFSADFTKGSRRPIKITNWLDDRRDLQTHH